jgi:hypothetical protein
MQLLRLFIFSVFSCVFSYAQVILDNGSISEQPWYALPGPNATGNFVFQTITSLLQHWPNTKYDNGECITLLSSIHEIEQSNEGHTIIAGTVAPGTLLYHGRNDSGSSLHLDQPEWVATDPEHAYLFCMGASTIITFTTTRTLRVAYFDGSSAAKMVSGTLDSQDVTFWGQVRPDRFLDEAARIKDGCAWGKPYGIDGFVRFIRSSLEILYIF